MDLMPKYFYLKFIIKYIMKSSIYNNFVNLFIIINKLLGFFKYM
jgi:hypothetical protein